MGFQLPNPPVSNGNSNPFGLFDRMQQDIVSRYGVLYGTSVPGSAPTVSNTFGDSGIVGASTTLTPSNPTSNASYIESKHRIFWRAPGSTFDGRDGGINNRNVAWTGNSGTKGSVLMRYLVATGAPTGAQKCYAFGVANNAANQVTSGIYSAAWLNCFFFGADVGGSNFYVARGNGASVLVEPTTILVTDNTVFDIRLLLLPSQASMQVYQLIGDEFQLVVDKTYSTHLPASGVYLDSFFRCGGGNSFNERGQMYSFDCSLIVPR